MKRLDRYLARTIWMSILLVLTQSEKHPLVLYL